MSIVKQKRNRKIAPLRDHVEKRNSKCKRSRNLMKKAHELSVLCNVKVAISIYDTTVQRLVEFTTDPSFTLKDHEERAQTYKKYCGSKNKKTQYKFVSSEDFLDATGTF